MAIIRITRGFFVWIYNNALVIYCILFDRHTNIINSTFSHSLVIKFDINLSTLAIYEGIYTFECYSISSLCIYERRSAQNLSLNWSMSSNRGLYYETEKWEKWFFSYIFHTISSVMYLI